VTSTTIQADPPWSGYCADQGGPDQITETVADWFATETLADYMSTYRAELSPSQVRIGISNVWRGACVNTRSEDPMSRFWLSMDVHPPQETRINRILLAQPRIRHLIGCGLTTESVRYCQPETAAPAPAEACPNCARTAREARNDEPRY
jgi:hypothetical protein